MNGNDGHNEDFAEGHEASCRQCDQFREELEACRHDLRQARIELAQAREIQEVLEEQLRADDGMAGGLDVGKGPRTRVDAAWAAKVWRRMTMSASRRALLQDIRLLHQSELFDADWYLAEYPDVANAGLDPVEHYLRFGVHEGRDPGPQFSTVAYLRDHPDTIERGVNPLVHFLCSGTGTGA